MNFQLSLDILLEVKIRGISEVQEVKNYGGELEGTEGEVLRSDNGDEYTFAEFKAYLAGEDIKYQLIILGQLEQNGVQ